MFPVVIFASLALTKIAPLPLLPRYDWLLVICLLMQWWMVRSGMETRDELKVITLFHVIGLALELFKVRMGSWSYPEEGYMSVDHPQRPPLSFWPYDRQLQLIPIPYQSGTCGCGIASFVGSNQALWPFW